MRYCSVFLCAAGVGNELSAANLVKSLISKVSQSSLRLCAKKAGLQKVGLHCFCMYQSKSSIKARGKYYDVSLNVVMKQ